MRRAKRRGRKYEKKIHTPRYRYGPPRCGGTSLESGGDSGARTRSLRLAKPALSQLSYIPGKGIRQRDPPRTRSVVGLGGLEPPTSRLSGVRSNQLSYRPPPLQRRGGDRARRDAERPHRPPSHRASMRPGPGLALVGRIEPGRRAGQAHSQSQAPEERRIAHGPEGPGGSTGKPVDRATHIECRRRVSLERR